jgi:hypothetical protein
MCALSIEQHDANPDPVFFNARASSRSGTKISLFLLEFELVCDSHNFGLTPTVCQLPPCTQVPMCVPSPSSSPARAHVPSNIQASSRTGTKDFFVPVLTPTPTTGRRTSISRSRASLRAHSFELECTPFSTSSPELGRRRPTCLRRNSGTMILGLGTHRPTRLRWVQQALTQAPPSSSLFWDSGMTTLKGLNLGMRCPTHPCWGSGVMILDPR